MSASEEPYHSNTNTARSAAGVEHIHDDDGPDLPVITESKSLLETEKSGCDKRVPASSTGLETIDDDGHPDQFSVTRSVESHYKESMKKNKQQSTIPPVSERREGDLASADVDIGVNNANESGATDSSALHTSIPVDTDDHVQFVEEMMEISNPMDNDIHTPVDTDQYVDGEEGQGTELANPIPANADSSPDQEIPELEAYLVEEDDREVVIATHLDPALPWYKQRRAKMVLCAVFAVVAVLAIALGVSLSSNAPVVDPIVTLLVSTVAPSLSRAPSYLPSHYPTIADSYAPSYTSYPTVRPSVSPTSSSYPTMAASFEPSLTPSSAPSACVDKILSSAQRIDLSDGLFWPKVAIDGLNMVVVAQEGQYTGPVVVTFYSLENDEWQIVNSFRIYNLEDNNDVAISGGTAFVAFKNANNFDGIVQVYERNELGSWDDTEDSFSLWEKEENPFISSRFFGEEVEMDGDLACVKDGVNNFYLLHRDDSNKWVQFGLVDGQWAGSCSISGDTIAIKSRHRSLGWILQFYRYNKDLNEATPIQDPIPTNEGEFAFSHDYLVNWDRVEEDAFVYRKDKHNQTFVLLEQLDISGSRYNEVGLDRDILVINGVRTILFTEQNGDWKETIQLDQAYQSYHLSGRKLLVINDEDEVYAFDITDCSQDMPTSTPSLSVEPTGLSLSSKPSGDLSSSVPSSLSMLLIPSAAPSLNEVQFSSKLPSLGPSSLLPTATARPSTALPDLSDFGFPYSQNPVRGYLIWPPDIDDDNVSTFSSAASTEECASICQQESAPYGGFYGNSCFCYFLADDIMCKEPCLENVVVGVEFSTVSFNDSIEYCEKSSCDWHYEWHPEICDDIQLYDKDACDAKIEGK